MPYSATYARFQILDFPLDLVQRLHVTQGLFSQRAPVGRMQFEELAPGMGHAADFSHAEFEAGLVTAEIIADQLAIPALQKITRMLAGPAEAEVVNYSRGFAKRAGGVSPNVGTMGFLGARQEHLHRRFINVNDRPFKPHFAQRIDQGLQLHTAGANPLGEGRTRGTQAGAAEHGFLTIQRQMVSKLRNHDVGQQARSRDALVDYLRRHRSLDQCFATVADPLATDMALHGEHARCVIKLLADIFTDAFERAATGTRYVVRRAGKLWRQGATLGVLLFLDGCRSNVQRLQLRFNGSDIGIDQIVEQTGLFRAHLLAAFGELEALELGDLVAEFFDQRFVVMNLLVHDLDGLAHLFNLLVERRDALQQGHALFDVTACIAAESSPRISKRAA